MFLGHEFHICVTSELQYLTEIIKTKSIPGKISGNSGMVHFAEIDQPPPPLLNIAAH